MSIHQLLTQLDGTGYLVIRAILSILWQSTILLAAAGALAWVIRKRGDSVRHTIWTAAVLALPLLPLLSLGAARLGSHHTEIAVMPVYQAQPDFPVQTLRMDQPASVRVSPPVDTAGRASATHEPPFRPFDYPWALGLSAYLLVVSGLLCWVLAGRLRIRRWLKEGEAVINSRVLDTFRQAGERLGLPGEIPVLEHPGVPAPLTCGILYPVIILPIDFAGGLSGTELRAVALHELAHVRRHDTVVFTLVSLLRAVFFFQPLLWIAARRISCLAELDCDRVALETGEDPAAYAELLTRIAFRLSDRALSTEMAAGILLSNSAFFHRVRVILSDRSERVRKLSRRALAGIAVVGVLCLLVATAFPLGEKGSASGENTIRPTAGKAMSGKAGPIVAKAAPVTVAQPKAAPATPVQKSPGSYQIPFAGENRITIDGNLADWEGIGAAPVSLGYGVRMFAPKTDTNKSQPVRQGFAASARCAANNDFLYIGLEVTDKEIKYSDSPFFKSWDGDSVEVLFYGEQNTNFAGQITVTLDSDGSMVIGGRDPISNEKYPYFWESLGARAVLKTTAAGYTVELAAPLSVLEWSGWTGDRLRGMNVRCV